MANANDLIEIFQFASGLIGGFASQAQQERQRSRAEQMQIMKLLQSQGQEFERVPSENLEQPSGFFNRALGMSQPTVRGTGELAYMVGRSAFAPSAAPPPLSLSSFFPSTPEASMATAAAPMATPGAAPRRQTTTLPGQATPRVEAKTQGGGRSLAPPANLGRLTREEVENDPTIRLLVEEGNRTKSSKLRREYKSAIVKRIDELKRLKVTAARQQRQEGRSERGLEISERGLQMREEASVRQARKDKQLEQQNEKKIRHALRVNIAQAYRASGQPKPASIKTGDMTSDQLLEVLEKAPPPKDKTAEDKHLPLIRDLAQVEKDLNRLVGGEGIYGMEGMEAMGNPREKQQREAAIRALQERGLALADELQKFPRQKPIADRYMRRFSAALAGMTSQGNVTLPSAPTTSSRPSASSRARIRSFKQVK